MMKNHIKQICIAIVAILCVSMCVFTVSATPDSTEPIPQVTQAPATEAPVTQATQPPETEPPVTAPPTEKPTQATTAPPTTAPPTQSQTAPPTQATQATTAYQAPVTYAPQSTTPAATYSTNPAQDTDLFKTDGSAVDTDTLKDSDWAKIAKQLETADNKGGNGDFDFIKNNENRGNNKSWLLWLGIALIVLGSGIIIAVIVFEVRKRKMQKRQPPRKNPNNNGGKGRPQQPANRTRAPQRVAPAEKRQIERRSKFDTDEVYIPRRGTASGSRGRNSGTRYKPRH